MKRSAARAHPRPAEQADTGRGNSRPGGALRAGPQRKATEQREAQGRAGPGEGRRSHGWQQVPAQRPGPQEGGRPPAAPAGARLPAAHPASRMTLLSPQSQAPPAWLRNML